MTTNHFMIHSKLTNHWCDLRKEASAMMKRFHDYEKTKRNNDNKYFTTHACFDWHERLGRFSISVWPLRFCDRINQSETLLVWLSGCCRLPGAGPELLVSILLCPWSQHLNLHQITVLRDSNPFWFAWFMCFPSSFVIFTVFLEARISSSAWARFLHNPAYYFYSSIGPCFYFQLLCSRLDPAFIYSILNSSSLVDKSDVFLFLLLSLYLWF